ncbi:omega-hydroxypalmitate O-feruloyl transferase-like [Punica granatum]|uniref:Omega-hydroxypalmitate O-feruloyl transferase-like n=1 Tax=Punica granatum TaxID=22663 RepID=A0A6P8DQ70_PUNGR|nr:omega-hydroxypalmitate O-feruloyl transferase-like [Punica granatum]
METLTVNGGVIMVKKVPPVFVTPESETPGGFYFLSSLDQAIPFLMQTIYVFRASSETVADVLQQSLAKALVHFYPLTGAMTLDSEGRFVVDCSKKSVAFVEAVANCTIDMIGDLRVPDPDITRKLVYMDPNVKSFLDLPLLTAQVTKFRCGGFTLGLSISHTVADGVSAMAFVNSWAEIARGGSPAAPCHDRRYLRARVPPILRGPYDDFVQIADMSDMKSLYEKERNISRMFTFSPEKIEAIKQAALADGRLQGCSTFSAVTAVVWRARSQVLNMKPAQLTKLRILVDIRSKFKDPLPSNYFGSLVTSTCCLTTAGELMERPISCTVEQIRKACQLVDEEYVRSRIDYIDVYRPPLASVGTLVISSWTRLSFGSTDFGWGDPTQFGCGDLARELCVFLPEGEGKKGTVVVMALPESAMTAFQELVDQM